MAPATVDIGGEIVAFTALLEQFGGKRGLVADPDWETISPHAASLLELGYSFSTVSLGDHPDYESAKEMLRDWGWSASEPEPQWW